MANVTVIRGKGPRPAEEQKPSLRDRIQDFAHQKDNVGMGERHLSLALGGAMAGMAIMSRRPSLIGALGILAIGLIQRGATGHCELYHAMGINTAGETHQYPHNHPQHAGMIDEPTPHMHQDVVHEASEESFPASDPPAYTPTTSLGDQKEQKLETVKAK